MSLSLNLSDIQHSKVDLHKIDKSRNTIPMNLERSLSRFHNQLQIVLCIYGKRLVIQSSRIKATDLAAAPKVDIGVMPFITVYFRF